MCDFFYYLVVYAVLGEDPHATVLFRRREDSSLEFQSTLAVLLAPSWTFPHVALYGRICIFGLGMSVWGH